MMRSSFYRVFDRSMRAGFVWFRPASTQFLTEWERNHVKHGGLLLRAATEKDEAA